MRKIFKEINVGDQAAFDRTITDNDVQRFVELTGDDNPLHVDDAFALKTPYKKTVTHGMLTASFISTLVGKHLPGPGALWMSQTFEFCLPVRVNDTLHICAEVVSKHLAERILTLKMNVTNQYGQVVLQGEGRVKILELETEKPKTISQAATNVTLITGASRGIGAATARHLASLGHQVIINYAQNRADAEQVKNTIINAGGKAITCQTDVSDPHAVNEMIQEIETTYGTITGLVCNAAGKIIAKDFNALTWENIQHDLNIQLKGAFNCVKAALPHFEKNKKGAVVMIGSIATDNVPPAKWLSYSVAKSALQALAKSLALEYGPKGIRFNIVSPGMTDTSLIADIPEKIRLLTTMQTPLRRLANTEDIAQTVAFLLSDASSFITGETLRVCGGQVML